MVQAADRGWGAPATISVKGEEFYAVLYGNIQLAGDDLERYRLRRHFGEAVI